MVTNFRRNILWICPLWVVFDFQLNLNLFFFFRLVLHRFVFVFY